MKIPTDFALGPNLVSVHGVYLKRFPYDISGNLQEYCEFEVVQLQTCCNNKRCGYYQILFHWLVPFAQQAEVEKVHVDHMSNEESPYDLGCLIRTEFAHYEV